jgi:hypothetical protein
VLVSGTLFTSFISLEIQIPDRLVASILDELATKEIIFYKQRSVSSVLGMFILVIWLNCLLNVNLLETAPVLC